MLGKKKNNYIPKYRISILGPNYSGKTSLINRFVNRTFQFPYEGTVRPNVYRKIVNLNEDSQAEPEYIDLEILDMYEDKVMCLAMGMTVQCCRKRLRKKA